MARKPDPSILRVVCPDPLHAGSKIVARGKRVRKSGVRQVYECTPKGYKAHQFSIVVSAPTTDAPVVIASPPPKCPLHDTSRVVRAGKYPKREHAEPLGLPRRQRYRCHPDNGDPTHVFTPPLPREEVHYGHDQCNHCEELLGVHHGPQAAARHSAMRLHVVVDALIAVAEGRSYTKASSVARAQMGPYKSRKDDDEQTDPDTDEPQPDTGGNAARPRRESAAAKKARAHWHLAADWVEQYSPLIYSQVEAQARAVEAEQMRTPDPKKPSVMLIDYTPVQVTNRAGVSRMRFNVLAAAAVEYPGPTTPVKTTRLRLLRALPGSDALTWKVFLSELDPFIPQFLVTDADGAQLSAIESTWKDTIIIPSMYHLVSNITNALLETPGTFVIAGKRRQLKEPISNALAGLRGADLTQMTIDGWDEFFTNLSALVAKAGGDGSKVAAIGVKHRGRMERLLPHLNKLPNLPLSTGGLELRLSQRVKPLLKGREHGFANLERTNALFDLVVAFDRGALDDKAAVIDLLRADNLQFGGWSMPPRFVSDRFRIDPATDQFVPYSSLSDAALLREIAAKKGLL